MAALPGTEPVTNVSQRLSLAAQRDPDGIAVVMPRGRGRGGRRLYRHVTFRQLDEDSNLLADGLRRMGVVPGARLALMVRPGIDFVSLVFAIFKVGAVAVLIDPGMGRKNLLRCLEDVQPQGFVAIPIAQAVRSLLRRRFPHARWNVTVGRRWFWGGPTLQQLRARPIRRGFQVAGTGPDDPAAIIFTTGSTGPPKGVLYRHGNFDQQVDAIRRFYGIEPGEIDLAGFPLFGLFNCAMGVTTVVPDMDPSRPARVDPRNILEAVHDWKATQAFASPALWDVVGRYCERTGAKMPTLRRVLSAGAAVPARVLRRIKRAIHPDGQVHTPYGATEALPVASISASEILEQTAPRTDEGAGTCVGRRFPGIDWKVIRICDDPIPAIGQAQALRRGEIGELIVRGGVVTRQYVTRTEANRLHKIQDGAAVWHRMGDVGYLDEQDRFWFCGRKAHRVRTANGTLLTLPCEAIVNRHEKVCRSALVGVGPPGEQRPVLVVELWPQHRLSSAAARRRLIEELRQLAASHPLTSEIRDVLVHRRLPVDIRHNAKVSREALAAWAARQLAQAPVPE